MSRCSVPGDLAEPDARARGWAALARHADANADADDPGGSGASAPAAAKEE